MAILLSQNPNLEGYDFEYEVFDILYKGEDLHTKPWNERHEVLKGLFADFDFKVMKLVKSYIVHNKSDFLKFTDQVRKLEDSEGAFYKVYNSTYELQGKTPLWAKVKNQKELHAVVLAIHEISQK